jgi:hypothetical protein
MQEEAAAKDDREAALMPAIQPTAKGGFLPVRLRARSACCALATRLTEDANTGVILIEVGGDIDRHQRTHYHDRRKRRGHDQGGRAGAAGGLRVIGLVSFLPPSWPATVPAVRGGTVRRPMAGTDPRDKPGDFGPAMTHGER